MRRLRAVVAALVLLVAVACTGTSTPVGGGGEPLTAASPGKVHCGYERWAVKTGSDPAAHSVDLTPVPATIDEMLALASPLPPVKGKYPPQTKRQPAEERTVTLTATLVAYSIEQDDDFHLVLVDGQARSMIAEIPAPACVAATSPFRPGVTAARAAFVKATGYNPAEPPPGQYAPAFASANVQVTVTGVVFFDFVHGQRGVAGNGVELHPVLAITFAGAPTPSPTATRKPRRHHHRPRPSPTTTA